MVHGTNRSTSWTDDLPKCDKTGSAMARNGRYKADGKVDFEHEFEDRHLSVNYDAAGTTGTCLYGVFDGHDGSARASEYAQDKFPADLLYERLPKAQSALDLCNALQLSFRAVERGFFASLDSLLAKRDNIRAQLPPGLNDYQLSQQVPTLVSELQQLNEATYGGTTAALALVHQNSLYTANVGDSRVVLSSCANSVLQMIQHANGGLAPAQDLVEAHQLTVDHDTNNEQELERLSSIGLDRERIRRNGRIGSHENTRSIGDYSMKGGYRDFDEVRHAMSEPMIADPFIHQALPIQSNWLFMFLMSDGVYKAVQESHDLPPNMANTYIAQIISHHLLISQSIQMATEQALNYILTDHLKAFLSGDPVKAVSCRKRDDCTLIVRCFHHAVPYQQPPVHQSAPPVFPCVGVATNTSGEASTPLTVITHQTSATHLDQPQAGPSAASPLFMARDPTTPFTYQPPPHVNREVSTSSGERTPRANVGGSSALFLTPQQSVQSVGSVTSGGSRMTPTTPSTPSPMGSGRGFNTARQLDPVASPHLAAVQEAQSVSPDANVSAVGVDDSTASKFVVTGSSGCPENMVPMHVGNRMPVNFPKSFPSHLQGE